MQTIKMPKKLLKAWLEALRSGKYKQGRGALRVDEVNDPHYCCLGVLQMVCDGKVESGIAGDGTTLYKSMPSLKWLKDKGITFSQYGVKTHSDPDLSSLHTTASGANDGMGDLDGYSFAEIADAIELAAAPSP